MLLGISFLKLAKSRKTTYEFSDKHINDEDIKNMLEAARWAPSAKNAQPWHFIVIKNPVKIDDLTDLCYYHNFHTNPQLIIAVILDKSNKVARGDVDAYISAAQACLNMVYQAQDSGISSCYLSPKNGKADKLLNIPEKMEIALLIGFGYEKSGAFHKNRERKELSDMVFYEKFGDTNEKQ